MLPASKPATAIAALDQCGSAEGASYGIDESAYSTDAEMYDLIQAARARIITSPAFTSDRILGAILFEATHRQIDGEGVAALPVAAQGHHSVRQDR